jgi:hypothetical protein
MAWLSVLSLTSDTKLRELAHQIASSCHAAVNRAVGPRIADLELAEARGYVRARSSSLIRHEIEQLVSEQPKLQYSREELEHLASEATIRQVVWQMLSDRKQHQAAGAMTRRAA